MRTIHFYRNYQGFQGGHLKIFHYFQHVKSFFDFRPGIYFHPDSRLDHDNPWAREKGAILTRWEPAKADLLLFAGMDWEALPANERDNFPTPVINLIQGFGHADPVSPLYAFLSHRAVRICVSPEVRNAIIATGRVNGPVFVIPNSHDLEIAPPDETNRQKNGSIIIAGHKNPVMAERLEAELGKRGIAAEVLKGFIPRTTFLEKLRGAAIAVLLPLPREGFYLPALEVMALGGLVVCPDCGGNRSFCHDRLNCLRPPYTLEAMTTAILQASRMEQAAGSAMREQARKTAADHTLSREKKRFQAILHQIIA